VTKRATCVRIPTSLNDTFMNGPMAFCPRCKKDVIFAETGRVRRCTECGFTFELTEPTIAETDWGGAVMTVAHVLLRVFLIIGAIMLLGMAALFATCAFHL
jgi:uncharacterized protein (DUF983 family)